MSRADKEYCNQYEITQSVEIGTKRFVLGRCMDDPQPYMVGEYQVVMEGLYAYYTDVGVSTDYMEIYGEFLHRQQTEFDRIMQLRIDRNMDGTMFTAEDCLPWDNEVSFLNQVIVRKASSLKPEFQTKDNQLVLAEGGFGVDPKSRGSKIYARDCWTGEKYYVRREEIHGIIKPEVMPEWARENAEIFRNEQHSQKHDTQELEV